MNFIYLEEKQLKELISETVRETLAKQNELEPNSGFTERWYTLNELCILLGKSKRTVQDIIHRTGLKRSRIGRSHYFKASDIERLLEEGYRK